ASLGHTLMPRQVSLARWNKPGQLLWDHIGAPRHVHFGDEAITTAGVGLDKSRASRRIAQHFANLIERCIQTVVEINEGVGRPELVTQFFSANYDARTFEEEFQTRKRLVLQAEAPSLLAKLAGFEIGFEDSKAHETWFSAGVPGRGRHGR